MAGVAMNPRVALALLLPLLNGCVSNTAISYFPDQRGPFFCRLSDPPATEAFRLQEYEVVALPNWPSAFALRKSSTNEIVIVANSMRVHSANANAIYERRWGQDRLAAVKLLVVVGIENDPELLQAVRRDLSTRYPASTFFDSLATDMLVDIYSMWIGSEYTRVPCDGAALDSIPFEMTLPAADARAFLASDPQSLQVAGRVLYRDAKTGWRLHRSFSIKRQEFSVSGLISKDDRPR